MTTKLSVAGPEDLLAAAPIVLGFEPSGSLVMLTFGAPHPFHARVDLPSPDDRAGLAETAELMLRPALDNDAGLVAFLLYTPDARLAGRLGRRLVRCFGQAGLPVIACLRASEGRWWPALDDDPGFPAEGRPYDAGAHEFRARAVYDGLVTLGSRDELAATLASDPPGVAAVERALAGAGPPDPAGLAALVARGLGEGVVLASVEVAALLLALAEAYDETSIGLTRANSRGHVRLWTDVVRRAPAGLMADPAALLALSAWLHGQGALAWCALDRCLAVEPSHPLGRAVATALEEALPPQRWLDEGRVS